LAPFVAQEHTGGRLGILARDNASPDKEVEVSIAIEVAGRGHGATEVEWWKGARRRRLKVTLAIVEIESVLEKR
jgi:hypothetical protein